MTEKHEKCPRGQRVKIKMEMSEPIHGISVLRPNKKISVFTVTRPYLNLLVRPRIF